jgi:hypothetical protein
VQRTLIFSLLVVSAAVALVVGAYSALADTGPVGSVASAVVGTEEADNGETVHGDEDGDDGDDGDTDGDTDGDADGNAAVEGDDVDANGPNPDRGCANGSLDHARDVLTILLERDHPGENKGIRNALEKMCHGFFATAESVEAGGGDGTVGDGSTHPGKGHAFGRGHGDGKPEGAPTNDDGEDEGDGPPDHAPAHGRR